jgi:hypothetical protein
MHGWILISKPQCDNLYFENLSWSYKLLMLYLKLCPNFSSWNYKPNQAQYFPWTWLKPKCNPKTTQSANKLSYNMNSHFCKSYRRIIIGITNPPYLLMTWHSTICKLQEWVSINTSIKMSKLWQKNGSTCTMPSHLPKNFKLVCFQTNWNSPYTSIFHLVQMSFQIDIVCQIYEY